MKNRIISLMLAAVTLMCCSCSSMFDAEYSTLSDHTAASIPSGDQDQTALEVSTSNALESALLNMVDKHLTYSLIRFISYEGNVEEDLSSVCSSIPYNTYKGAYAVRYINYTVNKIVSYYEAEISIVYKRTAREMRNITIISGDRQLKDILREALDSKRTTLPLLVANDRYAFDVMSKHLEDIYYSDPLLVTYMPDVTAVSYPADSYPCVIELTFTYPYDSTITERRTDAIVKAANEIIEGAQELDEDDMIPYLAQSLRENTTYLADQEGQQNYSRWYNSYTAYGSLVMGKAASEGYAMAFKIMCDKLEIPCLVIRGRYNGVTHAWNLVELPNGSMYHLDIPLMDADSMFRTDMEVMGTYWWDTAQYPACDGASLLPPEDAPPPVDDTPTPDTTEVPDTADPSDTDEITGTE